MSLTTFAPSGSTRIAYDMIGTGHPVVLLHAGLGDRSMFDAQIPAFASHFTVIRIDLRGFGESIRTPEPYRSCDDVLSVLDHLKLDRAHLVGVSLGSHVAIDIAVAAPESVSALVAVAARTGTPVSDQLRASWNEVDRIHEAEGIDAAVEYELKMWVDGPRRTPESVPADIRTRIGAMNKALFLREDTDDQEEDLDPPAAERLNEIIAPTLVLWGDQDQADVQRAGPRLTSSIPGARSVVMQNTAHMPHMEQPDIFNQIVLGFLERH